MWQPTPCCIGPVWDATTNEEVFLCSICDCKHPAVVEELGEPEMPWYLVERDCVVDWCAEQMLLGEGVEAEDFLCFAFPLGNKRPNELRYFHYSEIAKLLGATGQGRRVKLPACVYKRIAATYPDKQGSRTKVGYKQDADRRDAPTAIRLHRNR